MVIKTAKDKENFSNTTVKDLLTLVLNHANVEGEIRKKNRRIY